MGQTAQRVAWFLGNKNEKSVVYNLQPQMSFLYNYCTLYKTHCNVQCPFSLTRLQMFLRQVAVIENKQVLSACSLLNVMACSITAHRAVRAFFRFPTC